MERWVLNDDVSAVALARFILDRGFKRPAFLEDAGEGRPLWIHDDGTRVVLNDANGFRYLELEGPALATLAGPLAAASMVRTRQDVLAGRGWEGKDRLKQLIGFGQLVVVVGRERDPELLPTVRAAFLAVCNANRDDAKALSVLGGLFLDLPWPETRLWLEIVAGMGKTESWPILESIFGLLPHAGVDEPPPELMLLFGGLTRKRIDEAVSALAGLGAPVDEQVKETFHRVWKGEDGVSSIRYSEPKRIFAKSIIELFGPRASQWRTQLDRVLPTWRRADLVACVPESPEERGTASNLAGLMAYKRPWDPELASLVERALGCDDVGVRFYANFDFDYSSWPQWIPIIDARLAVETDAQVRQQLEDSRAILEREIARSPP